MLHVVFSTKGRAPWITTEVAARLLSYIGGIVRAEKGVLYDIGGIEDHIHMYRRWRPDGLVSDLMRTVKASQLRAKNVRARFMRRVLSGPSANDTIRHARTGRPETQTD
ncbi:MAG: transposase [Phycisphaerales bacterium]|nr:transposase [Phycisphaerales bacterium]